jgi:transcriptional regulator with XRE-family HTH domain
MLSAKVDGVALREIREECELTGAELAALLSEALGRTVHQSTVSKWERGAVQPSAKAFGALCRVLEVDRNELLLPTHVRASA